MSVNSSKKIWSEEFFYRLRTANSEKEKALKDHKEGDPMWVYGAGVAIKAYEFVIEMFDAAMDPSFENLFYRLEFTEPTKEELEKVRSYQIIPTSHQNIASLNKSLIEHYKNLDQAKTHTLLTINQLALKIRKIAQKNKGIFSSFLRQSMKKTEVDNLVSEVEESTDNLVKNLAGIFGVQVSIIAIKVIFPGAGEILVALAKLPEKIRIAKNLQNIEMLACEIEKLAQKALEGSLIEYHYGSDMSCITTYQPGVSDPLEGLIEDELQNRAKNNKTLQDLLRNKDSKMLDLKECLEVTDKYLEDISKGHHQLTTLNLWKCKNVTNEGLRHLSQGCPQLTNLNLYDCGNITNTGLEYIAKGCPQLVVLELGGCENVTDMGLEYIAKGCPRLAVLELGGCENVTDIGLKHIAKNCPQLIKLNLAGCRKITDAGLKYIAKGCHQLATLYLCRVENITDAGLKYIAKGCSQLTDLDLWDCNNVTDAGLDHISKGCPQLKDLNLDGCFNITSAGLRYISKNCKIER